MDCRSVVPETMDRASPGVSFLPEGEVSDRESSGRISSEADGKLPGTVSGTGIPWVRSALSAALLSRWLDFED